MWREKKRDESVVAYVAYRNILSLSLLTNIILIYRARDRAEEISFVDIKCE